MIEERARLLLSEVPAGVTVVAAAKTRSVDEVLAAVAGGVRVIGENYVQEARAHIEALRGEPSGPVTPQRGEGVACNTTLLEREAIEPQPEGLASCPREGVGPFGSAFSSKPVGFAMIGHLQRNKVREAVRLFDMIQTVDSLRLAEVINKECRKIDRVMPILIEVNSAREPQKTGIFPEAVLELTRDMARLEFLRIEGLMTMGPVGAEPESVRPYFAETKRLFDELARLDLPNVRMKTLSMGMSDSYGVAIEEGSTMIRLGTILFGPRS